MACGCKGSKVSATKKLDTGVYMLMSFTGKRQGAVAYFAEGTAKYMMGNTQYAQQARVTPQDATLLKEKYGNQLLIISGDLEGVFLPLGENVGDVELLADYALQLEDMEIETVGEIVASDKADLIPIFGDQVDKIVDALRMRIGLEVAYA